MQWISSWKQQIPETGFACSFGAQVGSFNKKSMESFLICFFFIFLVLFLSLFTLFLQFIAMVHLVIVLFLYVLAFSHCNRLIPRFHSYSIPFHLPPSTTYCRSNFFLPALLFLPINPHNLPPFIVFEINFCTTIPGSPLNYFTFERRKKW